MSIKPTPLRCFTALCITGLYGALAPFAVQAQDAGQSEKSNQSALYNNQQAPFIKVPIRPKSKSESPAALSDQQSADEIVESLKGSYILLSNGNVTSMADWIKGGLLRPQIGMGSSDFEIRMFLGQVALDMAGLDSKLTVSSARVRAEPGDLLGGKLAGLDKENLAKHFNYRPGIFLQTPDSGGIYKFTGPPSSHHNLPKDMFSDKSLPLQDWWDGAVIIHKDK